MLLSATLLTSCNSATFTTSDTADIDVLDKVRSLDILPRKPQQVAALQSNPAPQSRPAVYNATEVTDIPATHRQSSSTGDGFDLNFENTPVTTVAKVVLGDIMGVGYTIDPRVQGTVTLTSVKPVQKSDIIFVLENALRLSGIVLVRDTAGYRLTPVGDAIGSGPIDAAASSPEPGFGVSVVPLQYVSAQTVLKLIDSFATKAGMVRADATRNILLIQGTGAERRTAVDTALSFDVDWMRGQSVGIYPLANSAPEPIITELEKIMDAGDNGMSHGVIQFEAIGRLNAIMVVSRKPALLATAATWIRRLDSVDTGRTSVHVYHVKYGEARQIAHVLNEMFVGGSSDASLDTASNQIAPGSGKSATSDHLSTNGIANGLSSNGFGGHTASTSATEPAAANASGATSPDGSNQSIGSGAQPVLPGVRITADSVNNSLLIYADKESYRIIETTLEQVDQPQLQVAIDATIAEVTLNSELSYGVQAYLTSHNLGLKPNQGSILNTQSTSDPTATAAAAGAAAGTVANAFINRAFPGFNFLIGSEAQPSAILDALHTITTVKVLSNPSLVVINNQTAALQVGDVVPVSTGSATVLTTSNTVVNTIDYRNTGVILKVTPRININGNVRLDVDQEISNVLPTTTPSLTPTVSERKVKSSISVATGQTVLLAGLIGEQQNGDENGIPLLDQIPGLNTAFSHHDTKNTRTELIIFIRPQIIRDGTDAHFVAEELRSKLRGNLSASIK